MGKHVETIHKIRLFCKSSTRRTKRWHKREMRRLRRRLEDKMLEDTPLRLTKGWAD